jgi:hypothetical protein
MPRVRTLNLTGPQESGHIGGLAYALFRPGGEPAVGAW